MNLLQVTDFAMAAAARIGSLTLRFDTWAKSQQLNKELADGTVTLYGTMLGVDEETCVCGDEGCPRKAA